MSRAVQGLAGIVLGEPNSGRGMAWSIASVLTLATYAALGVGASQLAPRAASVANQTSAMQMFEHVVELVKPEPPPREPEPEPPAPAPTPPPKAPPKTVVETPLADVAPPPPSEPPPEPAAEPPPPADTPPPPAQAAKVLAADNPYGEDAVFTITTGQAARYAGGVTASQGTSIRAIHTKVVDINARPGPRAPARSLARPIRLQVRSWRCPWPRQADLLSIDQQTVVVRVTVGATGEVSNVKVVSDPGYGFGRTVLSCARRHRFEPARNAAGQPIAATSTIRVKFTR